MQIYDIFLIIVCTLIFSLFYGILGKDSDKGEALGLAFASVMACYIIWILAGSSLG